MANLKTRKFSIEGPIVEHLNDYKEVINFQCNEYGSLLYMF